jgi:hypothetical protein
MENIKITLISTINWAIVVVDDSNMENPIDSLLRYTKYLTALILVLNIGLILCIRLNIKTLKKAIEPEAADPIKFGGTVRTLCILIVGVIAINGLAVFANRQVLKSADEVTRQLGAGLAVDGEQETTKHKAVIPSQGETALVR